MAESAFFVLRLGKDSVEDIKRIDAQKTPAATAIKMNVACSQVPQDLKAGDFVLLWLGSDNNKGLDTAWVKGLRALGVVTSKKGGPGYNDEWKVGIDVGVVFPESITHDDFLSKSPTAYYWFSKVPVLGINTHSNQTIQQIRKDDVQQDIRAVFFAINSVYSSFKHSAGAIYSDLKNYFNYSPPSPAVAGLQNGETQATPTTGSKSATNEMLEFLPAAWVLALVSKGFVLVSGPSGTGKSKVAKEIALALSYSVDAKYIASELSAKPAINLAFVPVGADWTDETPLIGFKNLFGAPRKRTTADGKELVSNVSWEVTSVIRLLLRAHAQPESPHFLILDEMNLSHVERYFSRFLSIIEANRGLDESKRLELLDSEAIGLIKETLSDSNAIYPIEYEVASKLAKSGKGITFPDNLFIIGTVNVDETTYMFSPKVLDRAHVLEMMPPTPLDYLEKKNSESGAALGRDIAAQLFTNCIVKRRSGVLEREAPLDSLSRAIKASPLKSSEQAIILALKNTLSGLQTLLTPVGFPFAYRTINEVCTYLICYVEANNKDLLSDNGRDGWVVALDRAIYQKVLPRLHGNRRQIGLCLSALKDFLNNKEAKYSFGGNLVEVSAENKIGHSLSVSSDKIDRMFTKLEATGHTTFVI